MHASADKLAPATTVPVHASPQTETGSDTFSFSDQRPEAVAQLRIREMAASFAAQQPIIQRAGNSTGLPDNLQSGIEQLSGYSMDDVNVHYNSDKPQQLNARAYAQGSEIHVAPGEEKHLPHEAWHVVQQKQGRVKATTQLKGIGVNDDAALEREADTMGAKALAGSIGTAQLRAVGNQTGVVQLRKEDAENYIKDNGLVNKKGDALDSTRSAVMAYVNDTDNDKVHRQALLAAYNLNNRASWLIPTPADLGGMDVDQDGLEDWDSEDEDAIDLDDEIEDESEGKYDLLRSDGSIVNNVPKIRFYKAIRIGRQIVKRNKYKALLPIIMELGDHLFELNSPYKNDIYVTPLEKVDEYYQGKSLIKPDNMYRRTGTSKKFNYTGLTDRLKKRYTDDGAVTTGPQLFHYLMKRNAKLQIHHEAAETMGAIGADFMKGSLGARFYLRRAIRRIAEQEKAKKAMNFSHIYLGKDPFYTPALKGGRGMVVKATAHGREVRHLLEVNNCLINAIALAARGSRATIDELIQIRSNLHNLGEMMIANIGTINVIRNALGINNHITVKYPKDSDGFDEDFAGDDPALTVYHTGAEHFQHNCPDPNNYY